MSIASAIERPVNLDDPAIREADMAAVWKSLATSQPLDPAIVERVHARAEQATENLRLTHGLVDDETFQSLLDEDA